MGGSSPWAYAHRRGGTCDGGCPDHGSCHCGCGESTQRCGVDRPEHGHRKGEPFVFKRGHRARVVTAGGGAWTARGVEVERVRPLLHWLRSRHGSVRAVAELLDMSPSTVRGYLYKQDICRVPAPTASAIVSLVLAHRPARRAESRWELDPLTRWQGQRRGAAAPRFARLVVVAAVVMSGMLSACSAAAPPQDPSTSAVIRVGMPAPPFELSSSEGRPISSDELLARRPLLLYFSMGPG